MRRRGSKATGFMSPRFLGFGGGGTEEEGIISHGSEAVYHRAEKWYHTYVHNQ